jgi:predicted Rossmann fold flavoprotein
MKKNIKKDKEWDVVVIGGGPAGLMAAGRAAERGRSVLLLEKNPILGKKLLLTGGGRCNLTNNISDIHLMLAKYKKSGKFLFSAFSQFGAEEAIKYFNSRGMATKEEDEGRIFPVSDQAQSVMDILIGYMEKGGVETRTNTIVSDLTMDCKEKYFNIQIKDSEEIKSKSCVIATGGVALPATGSTGDGFVWLKNLGHAISENNLALAPIKLKDGWAKELSGINIKDAKLTIFQDSRKNGLIRGEMLIAHFGITGPIALNISRVVGELKKRGEVILALDLFPALNQEALRKKLQELLGRDSNKKLKNTLSFFLPLALVLAILKMANINAEIFNRNLKKEERIKLIAVMKNVPLNVQGLLGADKAMASSGGIDLREIDFKTMQSRVAPNLYIVGDALDIDRASGGYSLQLCWTTGFVAGDNV